MSEIQYTVHSESSSDIQVQGLKTETKFLHTDGFVGTVGQFRELSKDGVVIRTSDGDICIEVNNFVLVQNIILFKGCEFVFIRSIPIKKTQFFVVVFFFCF